MLKGPGSRKAVGAFAFQGPYGHEARLAVHQGAAAAIPLRQNQMTALTGQPPGGQ